MLTNRNLSRSGRAAALWAAVWLAGCTPPGPRALLDGERLLQEGRSEDAVRRLRTAVEYLPENAQAWNHLGVALHAARHPQEAADAYNRALQRDRNLAVAHFNLGCLWLEQGDATRAVDALRTHVGLSPRSSEGWLKLGQAQLRLRQWDLADRSFASALKLTPNDPEALNGQGVSHLQRRHSREAWQCFTNAIGQNQRFAPAWLNLAVVAHQANARPQAVQAYRQYATLRPDQARALGLDQVIRQLEGGPAPMFQLPPAKGTATNPPPAAVAPATNRPAAPAPVAPGRAAVAAPTNAPAPAAAATNPPAQPRSPPRRAEVERPVAPTNHSLAETPPAVTPAPAPREPVPPPASLPPVPATVSVPPPATSPAAPATVAVSFPIQVRPAATSNPPAATTASAPAIPATPDLPPADSKPVEVVEVQAPPQLASAIRDEPAPKEEPRRGTAPAKPPGTNGFSAPLIRPITSQRTAEPADKPGFWSRANPVNWFGSGHDGDGVATNAPVEAVSPAEDESGRWQWANPRSWFRSAPKSEPGPVPLPARSGTASTAPGSGPSAPVATPAIPVSTNAPIRLAAAKPPSPAPTAPPVNVLRYNYQTPPAPAAGDAEAARPVLAEAVQQHRNGRLEAAMKLYEDAVRLDPASFEARQNLAIAHLQSGETTKALSASETALVLRPASVPARLNFALALDAAGFPADAATEAEKVVSAQASNSEGHLLLGNLYAQKLGQPERARDHYLRVLDLQPDHPQNAAIRRWLAGRK